MRKERHDEVYKYCSSQASGHGAGCAGARLLGRAHSSLIGFFAVLLALVVGMPSALAAQSSPQMVIDGNFVGDDAGSKGYMCAYCSPYTATLELIGHYSDIVQVDQEKYAWLVGGNNPFSAAMNRWQELTGASNEDMENSWLGDDGFIDGWLVLAGKGNCWYGTFTGQQIHNAEIAFNSIMNGGTGEEGGGSSGGGEVTPDGFWHGGNLSDNVISLVAVGDYNTDDTPLEVTLGSDLLSLIDSLESDGSKVLIEVFETYTGSNSREYQFYFVKLPVGVYPKDNGTIGSIRAYNTTSSRKTTYSRPKHITVWNGSDITINSNGMSVSTIRIDANSYYEYFNVATDRYPIWAAYDWSEGTGVDPTPPDVPMPENPTTDKPSTDAPDVGTSDPSPTLPKPTNPTQVTNVTINQITPVDDILTALNRIIQELENHCVHLQNKMVECSTYVGEYLEQVRDAIIDGFNAGTEYMQTLHDDMKSYMQDCMQWLVDNLNFNTTVENNVTADPYDDSSLLYWLKRIYTKLGAGEPVNSKPVDPVTDPQGTDDWLTRLWQNFLTVLDDLTPSVDFGNDLDTLKTKFPFSVPWDVLAIMTLLVAPAQTPEFDIPQYALDGNGDVELVGNYEIDLQDYDAVMVGVRLILKIAFVVFLMMHTKDFMELIEAVIPV